MENRMMDKHETEDGALLRVLALGDVVGRPGREALSKLLKPYRAAHAIDLVIANGENAAGGAGIDAGTAHDIRSSGVDVITLGDHAFQRKGVAEFLEKHTSWCIRPFNLPRTVTPGHGWCEWISPLGQRVIVTNLLGRVFMSSVAECPFRAAEAVLAEVGEPESAIVIGDIHAEATSEKWAMGRHLDGRYSLLFGTHTHVQTADAQVLPGGTGYVTDLGMTGSQSGVIGMDAHVALKRFLTPMPAPYQVAEGTAQLQGVLVDIDCTTKKARAIRTIRLSEE
jgi:metallophosphoesterase (TIGR00282 family)